MTQSRTNSITWLREHWLELLLAFALLAALTVSPSSVRAKEADLPTGDEIFIRYVKATGGEKAHNKLNNRVTKASLELAAQGIKLNMTIHSTRPNSNYTVIESEFTGNLAAISMLPLVYERRSPGNNEETWNPRQQGGDVLA